MLKNNFFNVEIVIPKTFSNTYSYLVSNGPVNVLVEPVRIKKIFETFFQVRLAKDRKKGEKIVSDSQERAFWRVHRPPSGYSSSLEPLPLKAGGSAGTKKRKTSQDIKKEVRIYFPFLISASSMVKNEVIRC